MKQYVIAAVILGLFAATTYADKCVGTSSEAAENAKWKVNGVYDNKARGWTFKLTDKATGKVHSGPLKHIGNHAHLYCFINADGSRFAVLNGSAGLERTNRLFIYKSDGTLLKTLGTADILNAKEEAAVGRTVSHLHWLKYDSKAGYGKYVANKNAVRLTTKADRKVLVSLEDGTVTSE
jgi:hypothetical protein